MKIAVITCYKQPDYVRAQTLRAAVAADKDNELIVIKNSSLGLWRYAEVLGKVIATRIKQRPDAYLITFRGYEILPAVSLLTWPKKLIFDEFINPLEWLHEPRPEAWTKYVPKGLLRALYKLLLRRPAYILADTPAHAAYSEKLTFDSPSGKFVALPVSTDETLFKPAKTNRKSSPFRVFYYGNMLPLHGLEHVLQAAVVLKDLPLEFVIVGGKSSMQKSVEDAQRSGAQIAYKKWVDYEKLPDIIHPANLCLAGPFGDTRQASMVITGKTYQFLACAAPTLIGKTLASTDFSDKKNCLMVPLGDGAAIADAIRWAYAHPAELKTISQNGRQLYEDLFSVRAIAPQLNLLLRRP